MKRSLINSIEETLRLLKRRDDEVITDEEYEAINGLYYSVKLLLQYVGCQGPNL